jgi:hypothetical protein
MAKTYAYVLPLSAIYCYVHVDATYGNTSAADPYVIYYSFLFPLEAFRMQMCKECMCFQSCYDLVTLRTDHLFSTPSSKHLNTLNLSPYHVCEKYYPWVLDLPLLLRIKTSYKRNRFLQLFKLY